jgi:hypothetical protein
MSRWFDAVGWSPIPASLHRNDFTRSRKRGGFFCNSKPLISDGVVGDPPKWIGKHFATRTNESSIAGRTYLLADLDDLFARSIYLGLLLDEGLQLPA